MAKRSRPMTLEECAARMTAFLSKPPRSGKTRKYLETLPRREKVVVSPADYLPSQPAVVIATVNGAEVGRFVHKQRKDRKRPRARDKYPEPAPTPDPAQSAWHCRDGGRFRREWSSSNGRALRTLANTTQQRVLLFSAQDGICGLCGQPMVGRALGLSLDHVIPRSLGGVDDLGNLLLCHGECNGRKTNDAPTGCEMVFLLAANAQLGVRPNVF